jgi:hypothetical protein
MKEDAYGELFLWNRHIDRLIRILQRFDSLAIWQKQQLKAYEVRLEEIRAGLNADFAEAMTRRERADEQRLASQRKAWENRQSDEKAN